MRGILVREEEWAVDRLNLIVQRVPVNDTTDQGHHQSFIVILGKARESEIVRPDSARPSDQDDADDKVNVATHSPRRQLRPIVLRRGNVVSGDVRGLHSWLRY